MCWALLMWQHLLEEARQPFEVWTDHKNLEVIIKTGSLGTVFPTIRLQIEVCSGGEEFSSRCFIPHAPVQ